MQRNDADIRRSLANYTGIDSSDTAWKQAKMSLRRGGLGLRSLVDHSSAAYVASFCTPGSVQTTPHLDKVISHYNSCVADCDILSISSLKDNSPNQKKLSDSIEALQFNSLLSTSSTADRARLLSISYPHASAWISVSASVCTLNTCTRPQKLLESKSTVNVLYFSKSLVRLYSLSFSLSLASSRPREEYLSTSRTKSHAWIN